MPSPATYQVPELAEMLGISEWGVYQSVRQGTCPVPPIRVGRRVVFARAAVDKLLGLNDESRPSEGRPTVTTISTPDPITNRKDHREHTP